VSPRRLSVGILCLLLAGGIGFVVLEPQPVEAGFTSEEVEDLVDVASDSGVALCRRLMALDAIRKKTDSGIEAELVKLAKEGDFRIAVFACTALGKKKTTDAKAGLKTLVSTTTLKTDVRKSAMTALAVHFKSTADLTWMESETASDSDLKGHCAWLSTYIYNR
jgi:hypothetical protein